MKVSGPGIDDGVAASLPTEFTVDTTDAGVADLDVAIQVIATFVVVKTVNIVKI